ncbi:MAG: hypothetical protein H7293_04005 [Candidatus Saccharibacteria bacterium]|nr:hypothetical protein [Rhodoferax sp.]
MSKINRREPTTLEAEGLAGKTESESKGRAVMHPGANAVVAITSLKNLAGGEIDRLVMLDALNESMGRVKSGDLVDLEKMLLGQATALQAMFTSFAVRASDQTNTKIFETYMSLALKAQNQSRATISALVDLKYPRQATFVKQANITQGPQQINNGSQNLTRPVQDAQAKPRSRGKNTESQQNKLLELKDGKAQKWVVTRETQSTKQSDRALETVGTVNRTNKS